MVGAPIRTYCENVMDGKHVMSIDIGVTHLHSYLIKK